MTMAFTLVPVGPVTTESPGDAEWPRDGVADHGPVTSAPCDAEPHRYHLPD